MKSCRSSWPAPTAYQQSPAKESREVPAELSCFAAQCPRRAWLWSHLASSPFHFPVP
jgi:hypothetical protein